MRNSPASFVPPTTLGVKKRCLAITDQPPLRGAALSFKASTAASDKNIPIISLWGETRLFTLRSVAAQKCGACRVLRLTGTLKGQCSLRMETGMCFSWVWGATWKRPGCTPHFGLRCNRCECNFQNLQSLFTLSDKSLWTLNENRRIQLCITQQLGLVLLSIF